MGYTIMLAGCCSATPEKQTCRRMQNENAKSSLLKKSRDGDNVDLCDDIRGNMFPGGICWTYNMQKCNELHGEKCVRTSKSSLDGRRGNLKDLVKVLE